MIMQLISIFLSIFQCKISILLFCPSADQRPLNTSHGYYANENIGNPAPRQPVSSNSVVGNRFSKPIAQQEESLFGYARPLRPTTPNSSSQKYSQPEEFCSRECRSCNKPKLTDPLELQYSGIPGSVVANVPVIFYPDCDENAFTRPAIVPFCPSQKSRTGRGIFQDGVRQPLTMRFPSRVESSEIRTHMPTARNSAYVSQSSATSSSSNIDSNSRNARSSLRIVKRARRLRKNVN